MLLQEYIWNLHEIFHGSPINFYHQATLIIIHLFNFSSPLSQLLRLLVLFVRYKDLYTLKQKNHQNFHFWRQIWFFLCWDPLFFITLLCSVIKSGWCQLLKGFLLGTRTCTRSNRKITKIFIFDDKSGSFCTETHYLSSLYYVQS